MEEKKHKLSYEELENAAKQISVQLDAAIKENRQLKVAVQQLQVSNMYTELGFKFKVIENKDAFSEEFVKLCTSNIEEIMTPKEEEEVDKENQK